MYHESEASTLAGTDSGWGARIQEDLKPFRILKDIKDKEIKENECL